MAIDISRQTPGVNLPPEVSQEIWANAQSESAIMAVSRQIALPGAGLSIPIIANDAEAQWVAETDEKPVSRAQLDNKVMTPYKLAVIEPFSNEFRRDLPGLYAELARRLPGALAKKFDETVAGGTAPGSGFDTLAAAPQMTVDGEDTYGDLVGAFNAVAAAGGNLSHWIASPSLQGTLLGAVDGFGRPLFTASPNTQGEVGSVLGRPIHGTRAQLGDGVTGIAGDFAGSAIYGTVEGVQVAVSEEATINDGGTQLNLWQRNMFAIRAEIEVGFVVRDVNRFVRLAAAAPAA